MPVFNLHGLLDSSIHESTFLQGLTLTVTERQEMQTARTEIRDRLRSKLPASLKQALDSDQQVRKPRFFTQGSWSYKTLNSPCRAPQQADLDDGVYLPFSYLESAPPSVMSNKLFACVEKVLQELADEKGWTLINENPNCTRLEIATDKHIDVPAYSIPDEEFEQLRESKALANHALDSVLATVQLEEEDDNWDLMPTHGVLMATKDRGWRDNDPRPLKDWVESEVKLKTDQLRRLMRYVKGWRDNQIWAGEEPKSILLMVAVAKALDVAIPRRDDLALLKVVKALPEVLKGKIINPATITKSPEDQEDLTLRLDKDGIRTDVIDRFVSLGEKLDEAIYRSSSPESACLLLKDAFGSRMPYDPGRVLIDTVRSTQPQKTQGVSPVGIMTAG